jgi:lysophospholipase L1-like esterase
MNGTFQFFKPEIVNFTGRFDFSDPGGPKCSWSACSIRARFFSTEASVRLKSFGTNYLLVMLDGRIINPSLHLTDEDEYELASDLCEAEHEITLVKRTEFYLGTVQFLGFNFGQGRILEPPPASARRIEFIGDSITCAFGVEGSADMEYDPKYDNAWLSYGAVAARALSADCFLSGRSGYGIMRDYEGNRSNTLSSVYDKVLPDSALEWDFRRWIPHVTVINLGTNDFSPGIPDRDEFVTAYLDLVGKVRRHYPDTHIICANGPALGGKELDAARDYLENGVVGKLADKGGISYLEFPCQAAEDGYGISMHPSAKTHEKMAKVLADEIRRITGWRD